MNEETEIPEVWEAQSGNDCLDEFANEQVYYALKEYIEDEEPWLYDGKIEVYCGQAGLRTKQISIASLILRYLEIMNANEYWGLIDHGKVKLIKEYLLKIVSKLDNIVANSRDYEEKENAGRLSHEEQKAFLALFVDDIELDWPKEMEEQDSSPPL